MKLIGRKKRRRGRRAPGVGLEISGALSAASQMALLYPPGCDEWIRREFAGERGTFDSCRPNRSASS